LLKNKLENANLFFFWFGNLKGAGNCKKITKGGEAYNCYELLSMLKYSTVLSLDSRKLFGYFPPNKIYKLEFSKYC
jgi:hypothetical protein